MTQTSATRLIVGNHGSPPANAATDAGDRRAEVLGDLPDADVAVFSFRSPASPVAADVARLLRAPLDQVVVADIRMPQWPDVAVGAVGEDGTVVVNTGLTKARRINRRQLRTAEAIAGAQARRDARQRRAGRPPLPLDGRTAVIVDDDAGTGAALRTACRIARARGAVAVVVAVRRARPDLRTALAGLADRVVSLRQASPPMASPAAGSRDINLNAGRVALSGRLTLPPGARGLVVVAREDTGGVPGRLPGALHRAGIGTLLITLCTGAEARRAGGRHGSDVLGARLLAVLGQAHALAGRLPVGVWGTAGAGTAALGVAAAADLFALVARGARPDPPLDGLDRIQAPTLLIVGQLDPVSLERNLRAREHLSCPNRLVVVHGAGHLFEEPGPAAIAGDLAAAWFSDRLPAA